MAYTPFTKDDQPTMQAFNDAFEGAVKDSLARGMQIEVGSYVGKGTFGVSNANSITFPFVPDIIVIHFFGSKTSSGTAGISLMVFVDALSSDYEPNIVGRVRVTNYTNTYGGLYESSSSFYGKFSGKTFSWYDQYDATNQANNAGTTYRYYAIGRAEVN